MRMVVAAMVVVLSMIGALTAKGTPAGTAIENTAQIDYTIGNVNGSIDSTVDRFVVDRVVDIHIVWEDTAPVEASAGDSGRVLTFRVSNLGNADENVTATYEHNTSSLFDPQHIRMVLDNGDGVYDPADDHNCTGTCLLGADANVTVFLVGDMPDDGTAEPGDWSRDSIKADNSAQATAGPDHQDAVDTVIRSAHDRATGIWLIRDYWLATRKTATIHSDDNATHTGTRITYTVECYIDGNATGHTIGGVTVRDTIPAGTRYVGGSLRLAGVALTDAADSDAGEYDDNATQVEVHMGTLSGTTHTKMQFDVRVK
jgi:uncharacterized repeat protein (TIGR01451 family)